MIGPGAVIASLTIGAGELVFSSRAGSLFGYRVLWIFALVLLIKWGLVYGVARRMVLSGEHPFESWSWLPGPRGWLPMVFLLMAGLSFPVWVGFHAGTLGTLMAGLSGTGGWMGGGGHLVWGLVMLGGVLGLSWSRGYSTLERVQLVVVGLMLVCVVVAVLGVGVDWVGFGMGLVGFEWPEYPGWVGKYPAVAERPVWVEVSTYVGVIGGSSFDYLAYVAYVREKRWGVARPLGERVGEGEGESGGKVGWEPLVDTVVSMAAVWFFSAAFVVCGAVILGPREEVPEGTNLLMLQAEFVGGSYPAFRWLYFCGAWLTMFGTLYGTVEVAPSVVSEVFGAMGWGGGGRDAAWCRRLGVIWAGVGGLGVLLVMLVDQVLGGVGLGRSLIGVLTPANLFTGVMGCAVVCGMSVWSELRRFRGVGGMGWGLMGLNGVGAVVLGVLGVKAYLDTAGVWGVGLFLGTVGVGWVVAWGLGVRRGG